MRRRDFVAAGAAAAGALAFGPSFWRRAFEAEAATAGTGPYGPLLPPDANGLMLPAGFSSREIARGNKLVAGYPWHVFSDGQATYATADGGWILVSNSESLAANGAGASSITFRPDGSIARANRILAGTNFNCAGGRTPWGTWLSCEEYDLGQVWECDPAGGAPALVRPALGAFAHESVAVDPVNQRLFLTEDEGDGGFYRFTPAAYPDLTSGLLEVAVVNGSSVAWEPVPDPSAISGPTRQQVDGMTQFKGGEGTWYDSGHVYFTTKGDNRVWAYDTNASTLEVIYEAASTPGAPLTGVDNVTVSSFGDIYVCEDGGNLEICLITPEREVAPFLRLTGTTHETGFAPIGPSELAGVIFDPSGSRLYFSSQRGYSFGVIYEVSGPFRTVAERTGAPVAAAPSDAPAVSREQRGDDADRNAPGLKVFTRRRAPLHRLLRRGGLPVEVLVAEPGDVAISLTTTDPRAHAAEGGTRPMTLVLGRARRRFARRGRRKLIVKLRRKELRKLRGRRSAVVRVTAQTRDEAGNVAVANRRVRIDLRRA